MPIFTASGRMSSNTASIWAPTKAGFTSITPNTPVVFWAVSAVMTLSPNSWWAMMVFKSAWMPAPPLESDPAMVRTAFMAFLSRKYRMRLS